MSSNWSISELEKFRSKNKLHSKLINGYNWLYYDINNSDNPSSLAFVFIHGTTGSAEIFWLQIKELSKKIRVISVTVPPIDNANEIVSQLKQLLDEIGVNNIILLGTSFGGFMSQYFAVKYPTIVKGLVLGNTFTSTLSYRKKYQRLLQFSWLVPTFTIKKIMKKRLMTIQHEPTRNYLIAELEKNLSKKTILARLKSFINEELPDKPKIKNVIIINTEGDPLVPKELQTEIIDTFLQARTYTFDHQANHFPYLVQSDKYTSILKELIDSIVV